jgi:hypothetical protein
VTEVDEGNLARVFTEHPRVGASVERTEGTSISTRISPFAGRVTEARVFRKERPRVEREGLRPIGTHVQRCSDVVRARCGDKEVSGRQRVGAHEQSRTFAYARIRLLDSIRSRPVWLSSLREKRGHEPHCLLPRAGHRLRRDAPPAGREGALGSVPRVVDAEPPRRKQQKVSAIRRRAGSPKSKRG